MPWVRMFSGWSMRHLSSGIHWRSFHWEWEEEEEEEEEESDTEMEDVEIEEEEPEPEPEPGRVRSTAAARQFAAQLAAVPR